MKSTDEGMHRLLLRLVVVALGVAFVGSLLFVRFAAALNRYPTDGF